MDVWTDGKSPHSTGLRPLPGPLPCFIKENSNPTNLKTIVKQGKGTADHLMPLGDWFFSPSSFPSFPFFFLLLLFPFFPSFFLFFSLFSPSFFPLFFLLSGLYHGTVGPRGAPWGAGPKAAALSASRGIRSCIYRCNHNLWFSIAAYNNYIAYNYITYNNYIALFLFFIAKGMIRISFFDCFRLFSIADRGRFDFGGGRKKSFDFAILYKKSQ